MRSRIGFATVSLSIRMVSTLTCSGEFVHLSLVFIGILNQDLVPLDLIIEL